MRILIAAILLALAHGALAETIAGTVAAIADGDTMTVLSGRRQVKVRLAGIDAPESQQPFGARSRQHLFGLCFHRDAKIEERGRDRYGHVIARVWCAGKDANAEQVRAGLAWVSGRQADRNLYRLQDTARTGRRGLWADRKPVPPWEWRNGKSKRAPER
jgi:endonuclease YncB( thermonuclease family)